MNIERNGTTAERIEKYKKLGFEIIDGNDWRLPQRQKYKNKIIVRLCQTNSRYHGKPIRTVFAVRANMLEGK